MSAQLEQEVQEIKGMLSQILSRLNHIGPSERVYNMADLKKLLGLKDNRTVIKRLQQLQITPLQTKHLQVAESSLRNAGLI